MRQQVEQQLCLFMLVVMMLLLSIATAWHAGAAGSRRHYRRRQQTEQHMSDVTISTVADTAQIFDELKRGHGRKSANDHVNIVNEMGKSYLSTAVDPRGNQEAWRYTKVRTLFSHPYKSRPAELNLSKILAQLETYIETSCKESYLVFIDGVYSPTISNTKGLPTAGLTVSSVLDSKVSEMTSVLDLLSFIPDRSEKPRDSFASDYMTALNMGQMEDAAVIVVKDGVRLSLPVQVLYVNTLTAGTPTSSYPRTVVSVGNGAELHLKQSLVTVNSADSTIASGIALDTTAGREDISFVNGNTRMVVGRDAKVVHTFTQELSQQTRNMEVLSGTMQGNSSYEVSVLQLGASLGRINLHMDIQETKSNCTLHAVCLAGGQQSLDVHTSILHDAEGTISRQQQRNVIGERGEVVFKGRIRIPKHAQLTDSEQLCRSIMMYGGDKGSRGGRLVAMPTLEITADNVECSHGASVTDLDENSMFYLASRGIERKEARKMLLRGFVFDTLILPECKTMDKNACDRVFSKLAYLNPTKDEDYGSVGKEGYVSM